MHRSLSRGVKLKAWNTPFKLSHNTEVGNDNGIDTHLVKLYRIVGDLLHLAVINEGVDGNVKPHSVKMAIAHGKTKLVNIKIFCKCSRAEALSSDVYRIGTAAHSGIKSGHISRRRKKLVQAYFSYVYVC